MTFFNDLFGSSQEETKVSRVGWRALTDLGQLNEIINASAEKPAIIFKHSTRCSISRMVLKQFENEFDLHDKVTPYFLDLLEYRTISSAIAVQFQVVHQSPQLLVIKDGEAVYDTSHESIDAQELIGLI